MSITQVVPRETAPKEPEIVNVRCPVCRHAGAFHGFTKVPDVAWGRVTKRRPNGSTYEAWNFAGTRQCPNPDCGTLIFVFRDVDGATTSYPPEVIDFDATDLPQKVLSSLQEAIACHAAGAYRASALMVRRLLEELCEDKKAAGSDLKARIASLKAVAVIPDELLVAADELRILGNDAAHVEAKDYDDIGKNEAEVAIDLAKELLKAVYQYTSLVARLRALKREKEGDDRS